MITTDQLKNIAEQLKQTHLDVLKKYKVEKKIFDRQIKINESVDDFLQSIGNIDNFSKEEQISILAKLCAKFRNAHLYLSVINKEQDYKKSRMLNKHIIFLNNKVYLKTEKGFAEVKKIGGVEVDKLVNQITEYISYETNEWLNYKLNNELNFIQSYIRIGVNPNSAELVNGTNIKLGQTENIAIHRNHFPPFDFNLDKPFDYELIKDTSIIKINYRTCNKKNKEYFFRFVENVKEVIEKEKINYYIVDVRNNTGGNSELICPLYTLFKDKNMKGCILTNNSVFSSGIFAVYYAKKTLGATIIGQPLGQGNSKFGQSSGILQVSDEISIHFTEKYINQFAEVFKCEGAIQPDIYVPLTLEDIQAKRDATLSKAIDFIKKNIHQQEF